MAKIESMHMDMQVLQQRVESLENQLKQEKQYSQGLYSDLEHMLELLKDKKPELLKTQSFNVANSSQIH